MTDNQKAVEEMAKVIRAGMSKMNIPDHEELERYRAIGTPELLEMVMNDLKSHQVEINRVVKYFEKEKME